MSSNFMNRGAGANNHKMDRNTLIENVPQISTRRARPFAIPEKINIASPISEDLPTPRAIPNFSQTTPPPTAPAKMETSCNRNSAMWIKDGPIAVEFDEMYDVSEAESEEVEIRISGSVKKRLNRQEKISKYPSLIIPSPSQWPTIEKLRSATALSPSIQLNIPPAVLKKLSDQSRRVPSSSSAPSLDGSTSGDESASLSSCPSTPDLSQRNEEHDNWDLPIQLDPSCLSLLQQLGSETTTQPLQTIVEVPEAVVEEMRQIDQSSPLTGPARSHTIPMRIDTGVFKSSNATTGEDELSALSIPSPGGFFASLDLTARHTWACADPAPSTSTAAQFYDLPFRNDRSSGPPTSTATSFYGVPWRERPADPVEHIVSVPSTIGEEDPITAKRGVFSPTDTIKVVDEIDEGYDEALKLKTAATIDRTAHWISAQDAYMKAVCQSDADDDVTESFKDVADAVPRTPEQPVANSPADISPGSKKSVRFADTVVEDMQTKISPEEKKKRISLIHDGTFWEGWRHNKRSQRARDVFQHAQIRAEAEHVKRMSCQKQYVEQLKGNYTIVAADRPIPSRPISFLPDATDDELKAARQQVERERSALDQISTSSWHVAAHKQLNGGNLITSPVDQAGQPSQDVRILDLHGQVHCSWAWSVAMEHKNATIYTIAGSDAEAHVIESTLEGPENHIVTVAPQPWTLPFADNFFDIVSARNLYAYLRTVWPQGHAADEWDLTLRECRRVLKPGGYLEFHLLDAELLYPDASGQALGVEFAFNLKIRGYDPTAGRTFLPRLKRAGFTDIKRAWMVLPAADVLPKLGAGKKEDGLGVSLFGGQDENEVTGSTKDVRAITGMVGARMWEQWMLKLNCEMGRSEERCLEGVAKALAEGGKGNASWRCLVGWARKEL